MKRKYTVGLLAGSMAVLSAGLYLVQALIYHRTADEGFYFLQDIAFLPINVLLVTVGVNAFIAERERREKIEKSNLLVSEFFAESGFGIIRELNTFVVNRAEVGACASSGSQCSTRDLKRFRRTMKELDIHTDAARGNLEALRACLLTAKPGMLALFENPNLLEHDRFTDMLWALYHLMDELRSRDSLESLPRADMDHLSMDIGRAYSLLVVEWAYIVRHMKERYPYLYSMASRRNPFEQNDVMFKDPE